MSERRRITSVPARKPKGVTSEFLDETIAFWQPRAKRTLTREDAREIIENLTGFFRVLDEWDRAERKRRTNPEGN
jgi:hypothetical protein